MKRLRVLLIQILVVLVACEVIASVILLSRERGRAVAFRVDTYDAPYLYYLPRSSPNNPLMDRASTLKGNCLCSSPAT